MESGMRVLSSPCSQLVAARVQQSVVVHPSGERASAAIRALPAASPGPPCLRWPPGPAHMVRPRRQWRQSHPLLVWCTVTETACRLQCHCPATLLPPPQPPVLPCQRSTPPTLSSHGAAAALLKASRASHAFPAFLTPPHSAHLEQHFCHGAAAALLEATGDAVLLGANRQAGAGSHHVADLHQQHTCVQCINRRSAGAHTQG